MQVTSLLSREEHKHDHPHDHDHDEDCSSCGHDHEHTQVKLTQTIIGLIFVLNAFVVEWLFKSPAAVGPHASGIFSPFESNPVASISAMIGAIILGYPIVWLSFKDIRKGN